MQYRTLGASGTAVSSIALGTMDFGSLTPEADAFTVLDAFIEAGGNLLDTSNVYGGGLVEQILGRWFATRPAEVTDRVVLATKGRFSPERDVNAVGSSRRALTRALDGSLRRLGRESVDLYQLHAWDPLTPIEETLTFLDDAVRAGKVNQVGLSNFTGWQLQLAVSTARQLGLTMPVTLQPQYSLLSREIEWEIVPAAVHNRIGLLPWSPLAGGFLSGKYQRGQVPAADTRAGSSDKLYQWVSQEYADAERNWTVIDAVVQIARDIGATPTQVALSWLLNRPGVTAAIVGARSLAQLNDNLAASDLHLDATVTQRLDQLSAPTAGGYPYGAFGTLQRHRDLGANTGLETLTADGSSSPTGRA